MAKKKSAEAPPPAAYDLDAPSRIDLSPVEERRATFRGLPPLPRAAPPPFDRDACFARLGKLKKAGYYGPKWETLGLTPSLSPAEARFWLEAMLASWNCGQEPTQIAAKLAEIDFEAPLPFDVLEPRIHACKYGVAPEGFLLLLALAPADAAAEMLLRSKEAELLHHGLCPAGQLVEGFVRFAPAWLAAEEVEAARRVVRGVWKESLEKSGRTDVFPTAFRLAAALGMHAEVEALVESWSESYATARPWEVRGLPLQDVLCGLGSPELVERHWRRLKRTADTPERAAALLACTGWAALDLLRDSILDAPGKIEAEALLKVLAKVQAPETAEPMLALMLRSRVQASARGWLDANPVFAAKGLLRTVAAGGEFAAAALERLRVEKKLGRSEVLAAVLAREPDAAFAEKIRGAVLDGPEAEAAPQPAVAANVPEWWKTAIAATAKPRRRTPLPSWAGPSLLPPLPVGEGRLTDEQVEAVVGQLAALPLESPLPLLTAVKENISAAARDAFAWALFQAWLADGAPNGEKWAFAALGRIGGEGSEAKLKELVPAWRQQELHARAAYGLECLRGIGSAGALAFVSTIAQDKKQKALSAAAAQVLVRMAEDRGLSRADLEDRLVPTCGLDEHGRRIFSFGSRAFTATVGSGMKPTVRDEDGKVRSELPAPTAKDDAEAAAASVAAWKQLKKDVKAAASQQAARLEQAMVEGRRWKTADFEAYVVRHPLVSPLARPLLWEALDAAGARSALFRITDERDYADADDAAVSLAAAATVGLAHPLTLSEAERSAWGRLFGDYEAVAPFPQLGRPVYALAPGEADRTELDRFKGLELPAPALVYTLERLGWSRGKALDGGSFDEHSKPFPSAGVTAVVGYEGNIHMMYISPNETLTLGACAFVVGVRKPSGYGWAKEKLARLGDVPPVATSEVLADLHVLKSKAK